MKFFITLLMLFIGGGCGDPNSAGASNSGKAPPPRLTKSRVQEFLKATSSPQQTLKIETAYGCVTQPAESKWQNMWVGFEFTGDICTVTVGPNNQVSVSFIGDSFIPVKSTSTSKYRTDLFVGALSNNQVLLVQYLPDGRVISVTQTVYNQQNQVVYGDVEGDHIKECLLDRELSRRTNKDRSCP